MMVIFISRCEKKALSRTRRVLDAFADRIGDFTWRTTITEEGLLTIKKLLRQSVTKNTAVACHWLRSRVRSELLWIVGSRVKFNEQGLVPVNSTQKVLFMDHDNSKPLTGAMYANTQLQTLKEHLFAVGYVAEQLHSRLVPNNERETMAVFIAGCLHDLGKIDPQFQKWVIDPKKKSFAAEDGQHIDDSKFNFEKYPRHNEISTLIYYLLDNPNVKHINPANKESIRHAIYWHHAKPYRKDQGYAKYKDIYSKLIDHTVEGSLRTLLEKAIELLGELCELDMKYRDTDSSELLKCFDLHPDLDDLTKLTCDLPKYKTYEPKDKIERYRSEIDLNAINNITRACVISADRLVSGLSANELHSALSHKTLHLMVDEVMLLESDLCSQIDDCLKKFPADKRSKKQTDVANELARIQGVSVLSGPAGCGKTKIALEWARLKDAKQIIWICPRVQVCQGLFQELTSDRYLPGVSIEMHTGEFKCMYDLKRETKQDEYFSGDIVITTIDQIINAIISHNKVDSIVDFMKAHVVFDEFHEYVNLGAFNLLFSELISCKKHCEEFSNTLLVSATPHYYFIKNVLGVHASDIVKMPSFNQNYYKIDLKVYDENKRDSSNPLFESQKNSAFVISNTAITAQLSFIMNQKLENAVLFHSKFKKSDKKMIFSEVYDSFNQCGTHKYNVLRSGPIVQASLNITCNYMVSELTSAEDTLQRLGRLDRFGTNESTNIFTIAVPEAIHLGKGVSHAGRFLSSMNLLGSTKAWYQMLQESIHDRTITLQELYSLYEEFHQSASAIKQIESDLISCFKFSVILVNKNVIDPIRIFSKKTDKNCRSKIKRNSLRGDNRYVQMAVCEINEEGQLQIIDKYAYEIPSNEADEIDNLTAPADKITGYGNSSDSLVAYMLKKHHNIKGGKKAFRDSILLNEARDQEFPIYLSYTPADLSQVGGESERHSEAIYYAVCDKQPIGLMSLKALTSNQPGVNDE